MSMALPTVAFDTPVSREYLGDYGLYASGRTAPALAAVLGQALDVPLHARAARGQRLRERARLLFSWERVGEQIVAVYRALVEGEPLPRAQVGRSVSTQQG